MQDSLRSQALLAQAAWFCMVLALSACDSAVASGDPAEASGDAGQSGAGQGAENDGLPDAGSAGRGPDESSAGRGPDESSAGRGPDESSAGRGPDAGPSEPDPVPDPRDDGSDAGSGQPEPDDLEMSAADFDCILEWTQVDNYRLTNRLGRLDEALEVARSPEGGQFPVGTVIQLVPQEAMVKRRVGYSTETNDWEFFFLEVDGDGTRIVNRGTTAVVNRFNGNCFQCHARAEARFDFVCGQGRGCDPLPLPTATLLGLQNADPRCGR